MTIVFSYSLKVVCVETRRTSLDQAVWETPFEQYYLQRRHPKRTGTPYCEYRFFGARDPVFCRKLHNFEHKLVQQTLNRGEM